MLTQRIFSNIRFNKNDSDHKSISIKDIRFKKIFNQMNNSNLRASSNYKTPKKIHFLFRNKSDMSSSTLMCSSYKTSFISKKKENSLLYKLKDKITKETLILEMRQELKYHIESNAIYNNFLHRIIHLKDMVKENRDKLQENTQILKETFKDKFNIIENYEKSIVLYGKEKTDIIEANDEIYQLKQKTNEKLLREFHVIQANNNKLKEEIDSLDHNIKDLEYKKSTLQDDLEKQYEIDKKKYEELYKNYQNLFKVYNYLTDEYNSYAKTGDEITKLDVKLDDESFARSLLIKEDLEIKLNDKLIENSVLVENMNNLKKEIKIIEDKQQEEKANQEKKIAFFNTVKKMQKKRNYFFNIRDKILKKSLSCNQYVLHK